MDPTVVVALTAKLREPRSIWIGAHSMIDHGVQIVPNGGRVRIGEHTSINKDGYVDGSNNVTIGNDCRIAAGVHVGALADPRAAPGTVVIEDDVWVGAVVMIHSGVTIGRGSVIGAGAVVSESVEPLSIVVGNPARVIGRRGE